MRIPYSKMHGLGNDFMLVNAVAREFSPDPALVARWSDRRTGVGFDQLLVLRPCGDDADFAFTVFNADGSEVRQCGNGARCVARFARARGLVGGDTMRALAGGRVMSMQVLADDRVRVDLGPPSFAPDDVPFLCPPGSARGDAYALVAGGRSLRAGVASLGNPHVVSRVEALDEYPVAEVGRDLQSLEWFPEGVNAGFMQLEGRDRLRLRVFERGAGETPACGSGACAAVAVGRRWGLLDPSVRVVLRGGELDIEWSGEGAGVAMTGAAEHVYDGEIEHG